MSLFCFRAPVRQRPLKSPRFSRLPSSRERKKIAQKIGVCENRARGKENKTVPGATKGRCNNCPISQGNVGIIFLRLSCVFPPWLFPHINLSEDEESYCCLLPSTYSTGTKQKGKPQEKIVQIVKNGAFFLACLGRGIREGRRGGIIGRYLLRESSLSRDKGLAVLLAWGGDYLLKRIIGFQLATIVVQVS